MLVTTNDELHRFCTGDKDAFDNRCFKYQFDMLYRRASGESGRTESVECQCRHFKRNRDILQCTSGTNVRMRSSAAVSGTNDRRRPNSDEDGDVISVADDAFSPKRRREQPADKSDTLWVNDDGRVCCVSVTITERGNSTGSAVGRDSTTTDNDARSRTSHGSSNPSRDGTHLEHGQIRHAKPSYVVWWPHFLTRYE